MKFQCQESCGGKCCSRSKENSGAFVFLTKSDVNIIEKATGRNREKFSELLEFDSTRFTRKKSKQRVLKMVGDACTFFEKGKCKIFENRPMQCKTFPFWPENMKAYKWNKLKKFCIGIGKGNEINFEEKVKLQKETDKEYVASI